MRSSHTRLATLIISVLFISAACTAAATPAPPTPIPATPTPVPTPVAPTPTSPPASPADPLVGEVAVTVSDRLRVRSQPSVSDGSIKYEPVLPLWTRMTVVGGPVVADGYTWYEVEPVGFSLEQGVTRGWVAMADHDATPWIALASSVPALLTVNWVRNLRPGPPLSEELIVCVTIENVSENDVRVLYSDSQFSAFDGDGFVYPSVVDPYFLSLPLSTGELRPGERRRGELPYVVAVHAQPLVRLRWHTGIEGMPELEVDLPAAGVYDPFGAGC